MKSEINGETVYLVNGYYEKKGSEITKYYLAGASRVAMRKVIIPQSNTLTFLLGDHLGSTSLAVDASTGDVAETRYREASRRDTFTGQYSDSCIKLLWYGSGATTPNYCWRMVSNLSQIVTVGLPLSGAPPPIATAPIPPMSAAGGG